MPALKQLATNKAFGGELTKYSFESASLGGLATSFNVFLPAGASEGSPVPTLVYLAGLTCNEDTGPWKSGLVRAAASHSLGLLFPDTSPRGANLPGEDDAWDFGTGAGFYLTASTEGFDRHYDMRSLVVDELPEAIKQAGLPIDFSRLSLIGHSMGGHGALSLYLRQFHPSLAPSPPSPSASATSFKAASAFAPICHPSACPWGKKAFGGYLRSVDEWSAYDSLLLLPSKAEEPPTSSSSSATAAELHIKISYGTQDQFYKDGQLLPEAFEARARELGWAPDAVRVDREEGYDHSYYFVSSFIDAHVDWHAKILKAA